MFRRSGGLLSRVLAALRKHFGQIRDIRPLNSRDPLPTDLPDII